MNRIELDILYSIKKLLDDLIQKKEEEFKKEDDYNTEQIIDKALKQLPYKQSKNDFIVTAIDTYLKELLKTRFLKQKV